MGNAQFNDNNKVNVVQWLLNEENSFDSHPHQCLQSQKYLVFKSQLIILVRITCDSQPRLQYSQNHHYQKNTHVCFHSD